MIIVAITASIVTIIAYTKRPMRAFPALKIMFINALMASFHARAAISPSCCYKSRHCLNNLFFYFAHQIHLLSIFNTGIGSP